MLASELPFEITLLVANFLQPRDKVQSCLVCKAWLPAFQESLFETLFIQSEASANKLMDSINSSISPLQRYGHKTRTLNIGKNTSLGDQQLYTLQQHLPYLENFRWYSASVKLLRSIDFGGWNLWAESLTNLEITVKFCIHTELPRTFTLIRSNLCRLKRLKFYTAYTTLFTYTFDDFELLNDQLPELTYMSLSAQFKEMSPAELLKVNKVEPRPYFKTLEIVIKNTTYEWLYYIAIKYPNISTLPRFDFSRSIADMQTSQAPKMFAELLYPFQHLANISVHANTPSEQIYLNFINQLCLFNVPIKAIDLNIHDSSSNNISSNNILESTKIFANTLEKIKIIYLQEDILHLSFSEKLEYYPRLVDLNIYISNATVMLDILLEKCPALKTLTITDGFLTFRSDFPLFSMEYGLSDLSLSFMSISASTLNNISISCKNLSSMHLEFVDITGPRQKHAVENCIDMSSTHFTKLYIESTQFINTLDQDRISTFAFSASLIPTENIWVYSSPSNSINHRQLQSTTLKLNEEDSKEVEEYFRKYPGMVRAEYTKDQLRETIKDLSIGRWASQLYNGYVRFKYGSARNLCLRQPSNNK
ncbi:hypothetical protein J3Q64DRAFT_1108078 [Phycomyces blakesleeanus]|uniref:F-box domain-containing protein n=1 Tax=Phycomyces blakesleeanus TaxID=4837 RepID=A0ABR3B0N0_PHYBL